MAEGMIQTVETAVLFVAYVAFAIWVWSPAQKARFEEAAWLPLREDDDGIAAGDRDGGTRHD